MLRNLLITMLVASALGFMACDNELDATAEPRDILVVYGILDPQQPRQYIRVSRAFLTDGDALSYAAANDLSVRNASVVLRAGTSAADTLVLYPLDTVMKPGTFAQPYTLFVTHRPIRPNTKYTLEINAPAEGRSIRATGYTVVPDTPDVFLPNDFIVGPGNTTLYSEVAFDGDFEIAWDKSRRRPGEPETVPGAAFDVGAVMNYSSRATSAEPYSPQPAIRQVFAQLLTASTCNVSNPAARRCFRTGQRQFIGQANANFAPNQPDRLVDVSDLSSATYLEITAVDTFLYNFIRVNDPGTVDFNTVRPTYSNLRDEEGRQGVGIFGSVNTGVQYVRPNKCSQFLMGLNGVPQPATCQP